MAPNITINKKNTKTVNPHCENTVTSGGAKKYTIISLGVDDLLEEDADDVELFVAGEACIIEGPSLVPELLII